MDDRRAIRPKRRGRYHHGDLRRALVDAALQLIEEEGVAAVSTRALARRLGVSHAAPAHHFPDRLSLLAEVAAEGFHTFAGALEDAAAAERDPVKRLLAVGRAYLRFATEHPSHLRVMFGREIAALSEPPPDLAAAGQRAYRALEDAVRAVAAAGRAPPGASVDELAFAAWSTVHGAAMLWLDGPARHVLRDAASFQAFAGRALENALFGLVRPPKGRGSV